MSKIIMLKEHSREYSLFRVSSWYDSMSKGFEKIMGIGVSEACAVYSGGELVSIYYEPQELKRCFAYALEKCKDKEFIQKEINYFLTEFEKLKEYYTGKKKVESVEELLEIQKKYSFVWAYTAIIFIIPTLPVSEELKELAYQARAITQEYNETPEIIFKESLERFFPELKGKTRFVLPEEIKNGIKPELFESIEKRKKGFVYYKNKLYEGQVKESLDKLNIVLVDDKSVVSGEAEFENSNEIKGQIAWKGKVQGKVKIVSSVKDLDKVNQGDILVTAMTMPKYIVAMKKASAFITDEGGITSHAAIIAREMNKPCIIGTKIATQVLKDNMLVEVDADDGVVRILK